MSGIDRKLPRLESDLLRTFLAVAKAGSVSAGASHLFRTQSAVSLQLQKLEETLGQRVFDRHGRGVSMTAAGEQLLPIARQIVETLDRTVAAMHGGDLVEEIALGIPEEYGDTILPEVLAGFTARHPNASIHLRCGSSSAFPSMLAAGDLDLALHSPERAAEGDIVVHQEEAVWAGSFFHAAENRTPLPVALFDKSCWWRERCLELLQENRLDYRVVCTSESVAGIRAAIAAGIAVGVLPESSLTSQLRRLACGPLPHLGRTSLVVTRSDHAPAHLADVLVAIIDEAFRRGPDVARAVQVRSGRRG